MHVRQRGERALVAQMISTDEDRGSVSTYIQPSVPTVVELQVSECCRVHFGKGDNVAAGKDRECQMRTTSADEGKVSTEVSQK
jgi:hypothetical protein